MEWLVVVCACVCAGAAVVCLLASASARQKADEAEMAAEDADGDAQTCLGCHGSMRRDVEELRKEFQQLAASANKWYELARGCADEASESRQAADAAESAAREKMRATADVAEVVKVEVAKLMSMIAELNKVRADNPPFVSITYGETGEPEKATVDVEALIEKQDTRCVVWPYNATACVHRIPIDAPPVGGTIEWADRTQPGVPFDFKPVQVHPVITESCE